MRVLIATPSHSKPSAGYLDSLEATVQALDEKGWAVEHSMVTGDRIIQRARAVLMGRFLESAATHLLFIDDDLTWKPEAALKLLESGFMVTGGAYPLRGRPEDYAVVIHTHDNGTPRVSNGWIPASSVAGGFMCVRREAIEKMVQAYPGQAFTNDDGKMLYDLFPQGVRNGRLWGEDYAFCNLWADLLGEIWLWPNVDFEHGQDNPTKGNYHKFLMGCPRP